MVADYPKLPKEDYHSTKYTPARARLFEEMEANADALIEAAMQRGEVKYGWPGFRTAVPFGREHPERNQWFEAVYDMSERELIEATNAALAQYRRACKNPRRWLPWGEDNRAEAFRTYVRLHCMIVRASGLSVIWR